MSDGHVLYCAASTGTSPDNCVIYSYNLDSKVLKNLFVTKENSLLLLVIITLFIIWTITL